jgi:two-component system, cell cycle response regulator
MRVLVVDDEPVARQALTVVLRRWGYEVIAAEDGQIAWNILEAPDAPQMVLMDWMMPGLDGVEVCQRIRSISKKDTGYCYVILLTGRDSKTDVVDGLAAGADDYVTKPFEMKELEARLRVGRRIIDLEVKLRSERAASDYRALHDVLTGIWNRRALIDHLNRELDRCSRQGACVGLIIADLDHFKRINDTYGHIVGDEVLIEFAKRLKNGVRGYDGIGRYGGEEFMAVINCNELCEAEDLSERLRVKVAQTPFETSAGPIKVTASFGVASTFGCGYTPRILVETADRAMYESKAKGRNRSSSLVRRTTPLPDQIQDD